MSHVLAQVNLERDSGLPEDRIVNTFHFEGLGDFAPPEMLPPILDKVVAFYTAVASGNTAPLASSFGETLANSGHSVKLYDQGQPKPRAVVASREFSITPSTGSLPNEVCLALSFRGISISGADPSRRRGRVYVGPFREGQGTISGADNRPSTALMNILANCGAALLAANAAFGPTAPAGSRWVIEGLRADVPKPADPKVDNPKSLVPVAILWVDNAWDTQRRRGAKASTRVTRP